MDEIQCEFGCDEEVRWLDPCNVTAYDTAGNVMKCKCGNAPATVTMGIESQVVLCRECSKGLYE